MAVFEVLKPFLHDDKNGQCTLYMPKGATELPNEQEMEVLFQEYLKRKESKNLETK